MPEKTTIKKSYEAYCRVCGSIMQKGIAIISLNLTGIELEPKPEVIAAIKCKKCGHSYQA